MTATATRKERKAPPWIPYSTQWVSNEDTREVRAALRSEWITQGPRIQEFESALADFCKVPFAVATSSGTAALHIACLAAGLDANSEAITSPLSFVATANAVLYCGGTPKFSDIDAETACIDSDRVAAVVTKKTRAVLPVHFGGTPCDMKTIHSVAEKQSLLVIEDACHALGAEYCVQGTWYKVGSAAHSDLCVFSFHPVKSLTTGEGGAVTTRRRDLYEKLKRLRNHGIVREEHFPPGYYEMRELGFNYRITDLQCALGKSQLRKLPTFIAKRRDFAQMYRALLRSVEEINLLEEADWQKSAYHLFPILLKLERWTVGRDEVLKELHRQGIGAQVHYIPIHLQPYYRNRFGFRRGDFPKAEAFYDRCLSLPLFPKMRAADVKRVVTAVSRIARRFRKK
jgi:UDP-4-amino-4,6-dideoxy-N-acetyl-beta-L-altrosamine transaminase